MYYNTCELCGANLDPGERCDCTEHHISVMEQKRRKSRSGAGFIEKKGIVLRKESKRSCA